MFKSGRLTLHREGVGLTDYSPLYNIINYTILSDFQRTIIDVYRRIGLRLNCRLKAISEARERAESWQGKMGCGRRSGLKSKNELSIIL